MITQSRQTDIDHLVVTARTLAEGMAWVSERLGVSMMPRVGGKHIRMGTHNALLPLGPGVYLEVIAIDPAAPSPGRARWFGLDHLGSDANPRLAHWVVRCDDIETTAQASPIAPGRVENMRRAGLRWLITVAADGSMACDGLMPSLIQWQTRPHPAAILSERGCRLRRLELSHPRGRELTQALQAIYLNPARVQVQEGPQARLAAVILTPDGERVLE
nr:VOC family protein [Herbaspirillum sp. ASV7]